MSEEPKVTKLKRITEPLHKTEFERTYHEIVPVRDGIAYCRTQFAVNLLLQSRDYEVLVEEDPKKEDKKGESEEKSEDKREEKSEDKKDEEKKEDKKKKSKKTKKKVKKSEGGLTRTK